jgi:hypothetical protein
MVFAMQDNLQSACQTEEIWLVAVIIVIFSRRMESGTLSITLSAYDLGSDN